MIKFHCLACNQIMGVPDDWAGKRVRCSRCKEPCDVPADNNQPTPPEPVQPPEKAQTTDS